VNQKVGKIGKAQVKMAGRHKALFTKAETEEMGAKGN
jgi:hypothetical protein